MSGEQRLPDADECTPHRLVEQGPTDPSERGVDSTSLRAIQRGSSGTLTDGLALVKSPSLHPVSQISRLSRNLLELATRDRICPSRLGSAYGSPKAFLMWPAKS